MQWLAMLVEGSWWADAPSLWLVQEERGMPLLETNAAVASSQLGCFPVEIAALPKGGNLAKMAAMAKTAETAEMADT